MKVLHLTSEEFYALTKDPTKKVLVDFYADWCGPCRMQGPIVEEIANENTSIIVGKLNVDEYSDVAVKLGIQSIPTLLIFKDGKLANKFIGLTSKDALLKALK